MPHLLWPIFPGRRGHITADGVGWALRRALPRIGLVDVRCHDLRRLIRSQLSTLGVDHWVAESILAHKLPGVSATYNLDTFERQKAAALLAWSLRLEQIVSTGYQQERHNVVPLKTR